MHVFVTGGSGFVGGHLIEKLVADGHKVSAMARSERSAAKVEGFGAKAVSCSLNDVNSTHLQECDTVVHAAAYVEEFGTRAQFWDANVAGTETLLAAAKDADVTKFLFISTEMVLFSGSDLRDVDETTPYPANTSFLYAETKRAAEEHVLAANSAAMTAFSLRPRLVWGPRDATILPAVKAMVEAGNFAWVDGGRHLTSHCHIDNLAHAVSLALQNAKGGQAYFIADDGTRSLREFLGATTGAIGLELPNKSIPGWVVRLVANGGEWFWRITGRAGQPPVTRVAAYMMSHEMTVVDAKARQAFGYAPVTGFEDGLATLRG